MMLPTVTWTVLEENILPHDARLCITGSNSFYWIVKPIHTHFQMLISTFFSGTCRNIPGMYKYKLLEPNISQFKVIDN